MVVRNYCLARKLWILALELDTVVDYEYLGSNYNKAPTYTACTLTHNCTQKEFMNASCFSMMLIMMRMRRNNYLIHHITLIKCMREGREGEREEEGASVQ